MKGIYRAMIVVGVVFMIGIISWSVVVVSNRKTHSGPPPLPTVIRSPSPTRPAYCVPIPLEAVMYGTLTPTPNRFSTSIPHIGPSVTPRSYSHIYDLSPELSPSEKSQTEIFRCNGTLDLYLAGPNVDVDQALELQEGDIIIGSSPPASLMGHEPPEPPGSEPTHLPAMPIATLSPTVTLSPASQVTATTTVTPFPTIQPVILQQMGDLYETVFTLPVGGKSIIRYQKVAGAILGPMAIAILPDDSFLIAVYTSDDNRILHYDQNGRLLNTIELNDLGILNILDLRVKGIDLFLLERHYGPSRGYRVHHLTLDGDLISSEEVPYQWPIEEGPTPEFGEPLTLEGGLTGIAIDCEGKVLLEVEGGYSLYRLVDVQNSPGPSLIPNGYPCNDKLYRVIDAMRPFSRFKAGDVTYETQLTTGFGGLVSEVQT